MSLVDSCYDSDDDDDMVGAEEEEADGELIPPATRRPGEDVLGTSVGISSPDPPAFSILGEEQSGRGIPRQSSSSRSGSSATRIILPDVSELLGPSVSDPATTSDNQRKRPVVNGTGQLFPHPKLPRGATLQPARIAPDTAGGLLTPPQLRGRSNVATEDLDKIFSRRQRR